MGTALVIFAAIGVVAGGAPAKKPTPRVLGPDEAASYTITPVAVRWATAVPFEEGRPKGVHKSMRITLRASCPEGILPVNANSVKAVKAVTDTGEELSCARPKRVDGFYDSGGYIRWGRPLRGERRQFDICLDIQGPQKPFEGLAELSGTFDLTYSGPPTEAVIENPLALPWRRIIKHDSLKDHPIMLERIGSNGMKILMSPEDGRDLLSVKMVYPEGRGRWFSMTSGRSDSFEVVKNYSGSVQEDGKLVFTFKAKRIQVRVPFKVTGISVKPVPAPEEPAGKE